MKPQSENRVYYRDQFSYVYIQANRPMGRGLCTQSLEYISVDGSYPDHRSMSGYSLINDCIHNIIISHAIEAYRIMNDREMVFNIRSSVAYTRIGIGHTTFYLEPDCILMSKAARGLNGIDVETINISYASYTHIKDYL